MNNRLKYEVFIYVLECGKAVSKIMWAHFRSDPSKTLLQYSQRYSYSLGLATGIRIVPGPALSRWHSQRKVKKYRRARVVWLRFNDLSITGLRRFSGPVLRFCFSSLLLLRVYSVEPPRAREPREHHVFSVKETRVTSRTVPERTQTRSMIVQLCCTSF